MTAEPYVSPDKITKYLLNFDHPEGKGKAAFFAAFGFDPSKPEQLADALISHYKSNQISDECETLYGVKQIVEAPMEMADGRTANVISVWVISASEGPRLITAYPREA